MYVLNFTKWCSDTSSPKLETVGNGSLVSMMELLHNFLEHPKWEESAMNRAKQMFLSHYKSLHKSLERETGDRIMGAMFGPSRYYTLNLHYKCLLCIVITRVQKVSVERHFASYLLSAVYKYFASAFKGSITGPRVWPRFTAWSFAFQATAVAHAEWNAICSPWAQ